MDCLIENQNVVRSKRGVVDADKLIVLIKARGTGGAPSGLGVVTQTRARRVERAEPAEINALGLAESSVQPRVSGRRAR